MWTIASVTSGPMLAATRAVHGPIPGFPARQPWRIQLSGGSDPAGTDSAAGWCWQSHQVPPGQSS